MSTNNCGRGSYPLHACVGELICTAYKQLLLATSLKFLIIKKSHQQQEKLKPMVETKTAQYVHDIELHFAEKEKKDTNKKIKKISIEIKRM